MTDGVGDAISSLGGGIASGVGDAAGALGGALSTGVSDIGSLFGLGSAGGPGATSATPAGQSAATLSQGATAIPSTAGGGAGPGTTAASFGSAPSPGGGGPSTDALSGLSGAAGGGVNPQPASLLPTPQLSTPSLPQDLSTALPSVGNLTAGGGGLSSLLTPKNLLAGGALGYALKNALGTLSEEKSEKALAGQDAARAATFGNLASTAINGQLPGPAQSALNQALNSAKAEIRSKYAGLGLSGSTAEGQDLANAEQQAVAQQFQIGQGLASTGLSEVNAATGNESSLYEEILKQESAQGTQLGSALSLFAQAAAR